MSLIDRITDQSAALAQRFATLTDGGGPAPTPNLHDTTPAPFRNWGQVMQGGPLGGMIGGGAAPERLASRFTQRLLGSNIGVGGPASVTQHYGDYLNAQATRQAREAADAAKQTATTGQTATETGGIPPNVARWTTQTQQTFGDLLDPDIMLAIMTNESGGDPSAYNSAGDAWGLFQQVGLQSNDPTTQFAAARKLAEQKLASIAQSYVANGLNPDARTRARDMALAWAGHFDYATGRPNPSSRDIGSGQTAEQLSAIFLANYDRIKAARQAPATGPILGGLADVWGNAGNPTITQDFGDTDFATGNPIYDYGRDFGTSGHTGLDIGLVDGSALYSPVSGTVTIAGGSGYYRDETGARNPATSGEIRIRLDNGHELILGHTSLVGVKVGDRVTAGQLVGRSGTANGPHLHLEYRIPDRSTPSGWRIVDPRLYLAPPGGRR